MMLPKGRPPWRHLDRYAPGRARLEWAERVVKVLVAHFPDSMTGEPAQQLTRMLSDRQHERPEFEFILDNPSRANWKLIRDHDGYLRVGCWKLDLAPSDRDRETALNDALATYEASLEEDR